MAYPHSKVHLLLIVHLHNAQPVADDGSADSDTVRGPFTA